MRQNYIKSDYQAEKKLILVLTHPQSCTLSVVTSKVQDALCGHGQACVLGETRYPVLMFVQILLKDTT